MSALPLSAAELVQMRSTVSTYLAGTAVIQTYSSTADGSGGYTDAYAASATVAARLAPIQVAAKEQWLAGRTAEVQFFQLTVPNTTTVDERDQVVFNSVTYEVLEVESRVPWDLDHRVTLVKVD
ncbi:MAG: head-tail adaptor protein [Gemmatimonadaceae bacterium]|nr:head-tail adaptor protein [Gemmatimonadaceae bacterium]